MIPKHLQVPLSTAAPSLWASRRLFLASSLLIVTALSILGSGQTAPSAKPKLTLDEFFSAVDLTKVQISPDGHMVVIATERADWDNERFRQDLWLWRDNGRGLIPLTQSGHDSSPRWSNDGKWIAFLSDRSEEGDNSAKSAGSADDEDKEVTHLYVIPVDGGEAFPVTRGEEEVHSFSWAPDSKTLYFSTRVPWSKKQRDDYKEKWKDTIQYRESERGDVLYRISVADALARQTAIAGSAGKKGHENKDKETGETPGAQAIVSSPYRIKSIAVSPDGTRVGFATDSVSQRFEGLNAIEVYVADTGFTGAQNKAKQLTRNQAVEEDVQWSPDGRNIFFEVEEGSVEAAYADLQPRIYSIDAGTGQPTRWASHFGGAVAHYAVDQSEGMLAPGMLGTETALYRQASANDSFNKLNGWAGNYEHVDVAEHSPRVVFTYSAVDKPTEVYLAESADQIGNATPITTFNKLFTERALPQGKPFQWAADDGTKVEGELVYPPGKFEAKNLRTLVLIHGGPMDADGNKFGADWYDWALYAASNGWLVFRPNYRGSAGYGDQFALGIVPRIVSRPGNDILEGVDALVKAGIADPQRLVIGGYSYGGYMTNWLITQTNEFKAAVTGAGAVEHIANWGNDDTTYDDAFFLGGLPWDPVARENYFHQAAIYQLDKVKTPTHIVGGEKDIRVAVAENYLLEHALHTLGIPSALLIFPGEGHSLSENPWHGKIKVREELKWLEQYCKCPE